MPTYSPDSRDIYVAQPATINPKKYSPDGDDIFMAQAIVYTPKVYSPQIMSILVYYYPLSYYSEAANFVIDSSSGIYYSDYKLMTLVKNDNNVNYSDYKDIVTSPQVNYSDYNVMTAETLTLYCWVRQDDYVNPNSKNDTALVIHQITEAPPVGI
jgi:hypothetical protein